MKQTQGDDHHQTDERMEMLKAFDETKAGVKGLVDSGVIKVPKIFVKPSDDHDDDELYTDDDDQSNKAQIQVPTIDLAGVEEPEARKRIIKEIRSASESWGFFQVVNHGVPPTVLGEMIDGIKRFHEMDDVEEKKKYYSRDRSRRVKFMTNYDLFTSKTANWRDTLAVTSPDDHLVPEELPESCRDSTIEYSKHAKNLGNTLLKLLSEALGLKPDRLISMECGKGHSLVSHYYPACPEPELTVGTTKHNDIGFLTILLQNHLKGLQVLHRGRWVDVEPNPEALVVNIGDLLQLVSNGRFKSVKHRVLSSGVGPRISAALFLSGADGNLSKVYGPIEELISEENPAVYRDVKLGDYLMKFMGIGLDKYEGVDYYKIPS